MQTMEEGTRQNDTNPAAPGAQQFLRDGLPTTLPRQPQQPPALQQPPSQQLAAPPAQPQRRKPVYEDIEVAPRTRLPAPAGRAGVASAILQTKDDTALLLTYKFSSVFGISKPALEECIRAFGLPAGAELEIRDDLPAQHATKLDDQAAADGRSALADAEKARKTALPARGALPYTGEFLMAMPRPTTQCGYRVRGHTGAICTDAGYQATLSLNTHGQCWKVDVPYTGADPSIAMQRPRPSMVKLRPPKVKTPFTPAKPSRQTLLVYPTALHTYIIIIALCYAANLCCIYSSCYLFCHIVIQNASQLAVLPKSCCAGDFLRCITQLLSSDLLMRCCNLLHYSCTLRNCDQRLRCGPPRCSSLSTHVLLLLFMHLFSCSRFRFCCGLLLCGTTLRWRHHLRSTILMPRHTSLRNNSTSLGILLRCGILLYGRARHGLPRPNNVLRCSPLLRDMPLGHGLPRHLNRIRLYAPHSARPSVAPRMDLPILRLSGPGACAPLIGGMLCAHTILPAHHTNPTWIGGGGDGQHPDPCQPDWTAALIAKLDASLVDVAGDGHCQYAAVFASIAPAEWHQPLLSGSYTNEVAEAARKLRYEALQELTQLHDAAQFYDAAYTSLRIDTTLRNNWCIIPLPEIFHVRDLGESCRAGEREDLLDRLYPPDLPPPGSPAPARNWGNVETLHLLAQRLQTPIFCFPIDCTIHAATPYEGGRLRRPIAFLPKEDTPRPSDFTARAAYLAAYQEHSDYTAQHGNLYAKVLFGSLADAMRRLKEVRASGVLPILLVLAGEHYQALIPNNPQQRALLPLSHHHLLPLRRLRTKTQGRRLKHRYKRKKFMRKGLKKTDMTKPKGAKTHDHHPLPLPHATDGKQERDIEISLQQPRAKRRRRAGAEEAYGPFTKMQKTQEMQPPAGEGRGGQRLVETAPSTCPARA